MTGIKSVIICIMAAQCDSSRPAGRVVCFSNKRGKKPAADLQFLQGDDGLSPSVQLVSRLCMVLPLLLVLSV